MPRTAPRPPTHLRTYFVVALGFTWGLQAPAVLASQGLLPGPMERYLPLAARGGFGPLIAAVLASFREGGRDGVRAVFASLAPAGGARAGTSARCSSFR